MLVHNLVVTGSLTFPTTLPITGSLIMTGSIGIGTVSPTARLHISGTTGVLLEADGMNGVNALFVSSSGNVGIGTNNPSDFGAGYTTLGINGSTLGGVLDLMVGGARSLTIATDGSNPSISARISGESILFRTNGGVGSTERMRITSGGNIGIGTTNPTESTLGINKRVEIGGSVPGVILRSTNSTAEFCMGTGGDGFIFSAAGAANAATDNIFRFFTGATNSSYTATEKMRITSDGYLRLASSGIQFNGDTAAANALNDYEEGTFTPIVQGQSSGTPTYIGQNGYYVKIGKICVATLLLDYQKNTMSGGTLQIGGFPFVCANLTSHLPQAPVMLDNLAATLTNPVAQMFINSTIADLIAGNGSTGNHAGLGINTYLGAGTMTLRLTMTYRTT
jgi:hypothetical protein